MPVDKNDVVIKIMGRDFHVKCPSDRISELHKAANYLDEKIAEICGNDKLISPDNLITIAALNVANELLIQKKQNLVQIDGMNQQINNLREQIERALKDQYSEC